jgi:hypothetical protein
MVTGTILIESLSLQAPDHLITSYVLWPRGYVCGPRATLLLDREFFYDKRTDAF